MRRHCGGRELDDHAEARDLVVALEARPDDRAVEKGGLDAWATAGLRAIHSWRQGRTAWSLLVPREKPTAGCVDVGQVEEVSAGGRARGVIGLGGCARKHRAGRFRGSSKTAPELGFGSFPKTAPVKIPEGRVATSEELRRVEANFSKSSQPSDGLQCIFSCFAPKGLLVLFQHLGVL